MRMIYGPKDESIESIYIDFVEAISEYDNPVKRAIRHYVNTHYVYRWTDFDVNDTDDRFHYSNDYVCLQV